MIVGIGKRIGLLEDTDDLVITGNLNMLTEWLLFYLELIFQKGYAYAISVIIQVVAIQSICMLGR